MEQIYLKESNGLESYEDFIKKIEDFRNSDCKDAITILSLDITHFKYINDKYGYDTGENLLYRLAELISEDREVFISGTHIIADSFVVAGHRGDMSLDEQYMFIYNTAAEIERTLCHEFNTNKIGLAVGVYFITDENRDIETETAMSNANWARKQSKEVGAQSVTVFKPQMIENIYREIEIVSSVDDALDNHEMMAYYQPKYDSGTQSIVGAEALVRWKKNDGTMVYPDQFIDAIERSGKVVDVDYYMYDEVFKFLRSRIDAGKKIVPVSMNVSRVHLKDLMIIQYVKDLMAKYGIPAEYLEFELTETVFMKDSSNAFKLIEELHDMGIKVSMDDFGSGFSSLNLISEMSIDIIKLDRCFLRSAFIKDKERVVLTNIVNMIKELEMESLCEGVESVQQSDFLRSIGCDVQQGFYFSKPISECSFCEMLDACG